MVAYHNDEQGADGQSIGSNNNANISVKSYSSTSTYAGHEQSNSPSIISTFATETELTRSHLRSRWLVLCMSCIVLFGSYYSYDNPAALHTHLKNYLHETEDYEIYFNRLYSVYSFPNIFLPFFGGSIVDRTGAPLCAVIFSGLLLLGQIIFAVGTHLRSWGLMLIGRTVYGLGGENIAVAQSVLLAEWFSGSTELSLAFGASLSISRLGSVLNNFISPVLANKVSTPSALWVGVMANALSVCISVLIAFVDKNAEEKCDLANIYASSRVASILSDLSPASATMDDDANDGFHGRQMSRPELSFEAARHLQRIVDRQSITLSDIFKFGKLFWYLCFSCSVVYGCILPFNNVAQGILLERDYFTIPPTKCVLTFPDQCSSGNLAKLGGNEPVQIDGLECTNDSISPILPSSINMTNLDNDSYDYDNYLFDPLDIYNVNCNDDFWKAGCTENFCKAQEFATEKAGRIMSIPYIVSAFLSPFLGHFVDRVGYRSIFITLSPTILVIVHVVLGFSNTSPVFPLILQGVAFSIFAAVIWPSVPLCVERKHAGTAFGVMTSVQNIGLTLFPIFVADLHQTGHDRFIPDVEILFIVLALKGVASGGMLIFADLMLGGTLTRGHLCGSSKMYTEADKGDLEMSTPQNLSSDIEPAEKEDKDEFGDVDLADENDSDSPFYKDMRTCSLT
mmetsp:Transcript_22965/g.35382  ORF Transcript_22965/g.35382 Transcript_22965/m.35382 type:complete len:680 (-) Transcript_22965:30-2069(-)|eukprot:CAMPEP_0196813730 /NCGR_PEP_ID=MMETSP1362-20130617/38629_1 /TAXON_ID=163516 /ORGANISM="Leptocylindrus danicus, Strain CCMP1856" /LENGTH=679 /DNA_ID=CAMNT_0042190081 /DNA_START=134 /DNA_END=2173 /DNA_ORIENTATION=+